MDLSELIAQNSLLLLFATAALGHAVGKLTFRGLSLGVSAVLFVGLAINAIRSDFMLPAAYGSIGLVLFVYSVGIASGPSFVAALRNRGLRDNLFVIGAVLVGALWVLAMYAQLDFTAPVAAGIFTGALTNTAALAGVVQTLSNGILGSETIELASLPAVGYSIAYPLGVLGPIVAIAFWQKRFNINYKKDALRAKDIPEAGNSLNAKTVRVTNEKYCMATLKSTAKDHHWHVVFGRVQRGDEEWLATKDGTVLRPGDLVSIVGAPEDVNKVVKALGHESETNLELDMHQYDRHRIFVSSPEVAGRMIRELRLPQQFDAMITRVKRGDADMLASKNLVLEYGDRVRILAPPEKVESLRDFLGDSYRASSSINIPAIGIGISLGLLVGAIPLPLPGGVTFRLGDAGGPLLVGLLLGTLRRSGPIIWGIPYTANLTLREFGLVLMLATIGTRSGQAFVQAMQDPSGLLIFAGAGVLSVALPFVFLPIAYKYFKMPFAVATGMLAAAHTQPAVQAYATQQANNDLPTHGYAVTFPTATILKIILSQIILLALL